MFGRRGRTGRVAEQVGVSGRGGNTLSRWLADRRVATKLLLVTGVAIAAAAAVGGLGLLKIEELRQTRQLEMGHQVPYITGLQSAALGAKAAANDERGFLISGEQKFRDEVQERLAKVRASLGQASDAATTDHQRQAVDSIRQSIEGWFTAIETEFDQYATDKPGRSRPPSGRTETCASPTRRCSTPRPRRPQTGSGVGRTSPERWTRPAGRFSCSC
jgi:hypothetical protein